MPAKYFSIIFLLGGNKVAGKGMYVELGAAIASHVTTGKPEIYLIGSFNHPSVFYYHPVVKRFSTIDAVLDVLGMKSKN